MAVEVPAELSPWLAGLGAFPLPGVPEEFEPGFPAVDGLPDGPVPLPGVALLPGLCWLR